MSADTAWLEADCGVTAPSPRSRPEPRAVGERDLTEWRTGAGRLLATTATRVAHVAGPHAVLLLTLVVGGLLVLLLSHGAGEVYESVVSGQGIAGLDRPVLDAALRLRSPGLDSAVTAFTNLGGPVGMPVVATLATLAMTLAWRQWTPVLLMVTAAAGSLLLTVAGKQAVGRMRPPLTDAVPPFERSPSFPSGHALNATVLAGVVAYLLVLHHSRAAARTWTVLAATLFAVAMGLSRVYLGHHWLTDVLAAWLLGLCWLTMVVVAHRLLLTAAHARAATSTARSAAP